MKAAAFQIEWGPFATLLVGAVSLFLLIYFYIAQRNFESNYKEVRSDFHIIDRSRNRLNFEILRSSLFAYSDQDQIITEIAQLREAYDVLQKNPLFKRPEYADTAANIARLGAGIDTYEEAINDFMLLNAGIKNSFVYLTSLSAERISVFERDPKTYELILAVMAEISQARLLSDATFLEGVAAKVLPLERLQGLSKAQQQLIHGFLIHVRFIASKYPAFVRSVTQVEASGLERLTDGVERGFSEEAKNDYVMLDRFVIVLLTLFLIALVLIVGLLLRSRNENNRLKRLKEELRFSLDHDPLTGLMSRGRFENLQSSFHHPALILINIDHFKHVNDFYGNTAGNAILKEIALLIRQPVVEPFNPHYFRLGGDDFGIILQNATTERARHIGTLLKRSIESYTFSFNGIDMHVTVSVAVNCQAPLLENGDLALKFEKMRHSDGVTLYTEALNLKEQAKMNIAMTNEVKSALERDAILPWFQPIVNLQNGEIVKYESLVRLVTLEGEITAPEAFLATAMQTSYYRKITSVMLEKVFAVMQNHTHRFSINLSMRDVADEKLVGMLFGLLDAHRERAHRLDIELLESEELYDFEAVRLFIDKVKAYGCKVAIDDFGVGYSNFAYLVELEIDVLKIDGSLVTRLTRDTKAKRTVETIVHFARQLGLQVVAEFVEDGETADALRAMGVQYAQGYYFGRPEPKMVSAA